MSAVYIIGTARPKQGSRKEQNTINLCNHHIPDSHTIFLVESIKTVTFICFSEVSLSL
jgi:hypothetical protein